MKTTAHFEVNVKSFIAKKQKFLQDFLGVKGIKKG